VHTALRQKATDCEGFVPSMPWRVLEEIHLHEGCRSLGCQLAFVEPEPATRRYTDFLLATAGVVMGLTTAAMSPCMCLYAFWATSG